MSTPLEPMKNLYKFVEDRIIHLERLCNNYQKIAKDSIDLKSWKHAKENVEIVMLYKAEIYSLKLVLSRLILEMAKITEELK